MLELPAAGEHFENLRFLIEFGALFQHSDNAEKKNRTAAAGENFENLRFFIKCGVLFQQSDNAIETFKVSRKK